MPSASRRDFLAASATALAAASLSPLGVARASQPASTAPSSPAPASGKRTLRKAVMIGMVGEGNSVLEKFQILRDCGFEGVEMDCPTPTPTDEIFSAQEKSGLKVHGLVDSVHWKWHLNCPAAEVRQKGREALEQCLRDGKTYGVVSVLLVPAVVNAQQPYDDAWKLTQEEIRKVLPLAHETGVAIAIENVWNGFLLSPLEAARYVDEFNDPMVKFHFDIGNVINYGQPDQWARILGKRIIKLHIKDFSLKKRNDQGLYKGFDVELGDGDANWPALMKALDEIGYSTAPGGNWATAEVGGGDRNRLKQVSAQMDKLFAMQPGDTRRESPPYIAVMSPNMPIPLPVLLEIAVDSLGDALAAAQAGADRLELVAHLDQHGLTPPAELVRDVKAAVAIPVMAMVRPDGGSPVADQRMVALMLHQAEGLLEAGADGLVFGALTPSRHIDRDATAMIVQLAVGKQTVFHRAFDLTPDTLGSIGTLIDRGVTRILTSGLDSRATAAAMGMLHQSDAPGAPPPGLVIRLNRIRACIEHAQGRIEILPCGGVRAGNARQFLDATGATQLHSACRASGHETRAVPGRPATGLDAGQVASLRGVLGSRG